MIGADGRRIVVQDLHARQQAFVDFLRSPEAQRVFGNKGYRPIVPEILAEFTYPTPPALFTIDEFGGWDEVTTKFFDPDSGVVAQVLVQ